MLARRELAEILYGARYHVVEEAEHDSASRLRVDGVVELYSQKYIPNTTNGADRGYGFMQTYAR